MHPGRTCMLPCLALMAAMLFTTSGCNISLEQDPATTVNLVISRIESEVARADLTDTFTRMSDGSGHMMSSKTVGDKMTVVLSPVTDVQSFIDAVAGQSRKWMAATSRLSASLSRMKPANRISLSKCFCFQCRCRMARSAAIQLSMLLGLGNTGFGNQEMKLLWAHNSISL